MYNFSCALDESYAAQVTVVGGGPAGICAAIAAARSGAKTLLIESGSCLGGMATLGQVNPFMTCRPGKRPGYPDPQGRGNSRADPARAD